MKKNTNTRLKNEVASGLVYRFFERLGAKAITFIVSIVLARILMPEDYGVVAIVTIFIEIANVFVTYGFGNALIVFQDSDDVDFSTCFYTSIVLSFVFYGVLFYITPFIAEFYEIELLVPILRVMGLRIPIAAVNSVQHAYVSKNMMFKKFFWSTLIGTVISAFVGIGMALFGLGVWSLVGQYLTNVLIDTIVLWCIVKWRPILAFSYMRLIRILTFGWKILAVGLIDVGYNRLRSLVIAKQYSSQDLAYYEKGMSFPITGMDVLEPTINSVMLPIFSKYNNDYKCMKKVAQRVIKLSSYILFPILVGLAIVSENLIIILLTDKWISCAIFLQIGCVAYILRPIQVINNTIIKATGRSGLLLVLNIIKKCIGVIFLVIGMRYGVIEIAISLVLTNITSTIINIIPNRRILNYGYIEQLKDILKPLFLSLLMGGVVMLVSIIELHNILLLIVQIFVGVVTYIVSSIISKDENFYYLKNYYFSKKK